MTAKQVIPAERYEFWQHARSGEVWAVRLTPLGHVTGSCGPLHYLDRQRQLLPEYHYDDEPEETEWIKEHETQFYLTDEPYR